MWPFRKKPEKKPKLIGNSVGSMYRYDLGRTGCINTEPLRSIQGIKWEYKYGVQFRSLSPVVYKNHLCVLSEDNYLHAINIDNGKLEWKYLCSKPNDFTIPVCSPAVADDTIFINNSNYLFALGVEKGNLKWKFEAPSGGSSSPIVYKNMVCFGCLKRLYAIDVFTGKEIWSAEIENFTNKVPAIDVNSDLIIIIADDKLLIFDVNTGKKYSVYRTSDTSYPPCIYNSKVFIGAWNTSGINVLDLATNNVSDFSIGYLTTPLTISAGKIYAVVQSKLLRSWEYKEKSYTQERLWSYQTEGQFYDYPLTIAGEVIYTSSFYTASQKYLHAFDSSSGLELWKFPDAPSLPPLVKDKIIYCVCMGDTYYDLSQQKWSGRIFALN